MSRHLPVDGHVHGLSGDDMPALAVGLDRVVERLLPLHTQLCPRQILGARIGLHAGELLGLELPRRDKRLLAIVESDGCFLDGVAEATGCRAGRRTMRIVDYGKVAATLIDTVDGRAIRIWPHPEARRCAPQYAPGARDRWHAQLDGYYRMPVSELLLAEAVQLTDSLGAILGRAGVRIECERCGEEVMNDRQVAIGERSLCRGCAGGAYVSGTSTSWFPPGWLTRSEVPSTTPALMAAATSAPARGGV